MTEFSAQARFDAIFGPTSPEQPDLPRSLRRVVYARMRHAFAGEQHREARMYFMRVFHPDPGGSVFTRDERHAVFIRIAEIFGDNPKEGS